MKKVAPKLLFSLCTVKHFYRTRPFHSWKLWEIPCPIKSRSWDNNYCSFWPFSQQSKAVLVFPPSSLEVVRAERGTVLEVALVLLRGKPQQAEGPNKVESNRKNPQVDAREIIWLEILENTSSSPNCSACDKKSFYSCIFLATTGLWTKSVLVFLLPSILTNWK